MPGLTIGWQYLTGYAVATDPSSRERAEWPPHPVRVFMAMAAAWFETAPAGEATEERRHEHQTEGKALRWLESLDEPEMWLPTLESDGERSQATVYMPINDKAGPATATLQCVPALTRSKQPRMFPRRYVGDAPCFLHWPETSVSDGHRDALARLCPKVTRIGHSSSLVGMWLADGTDLNDRPELEQWQCGEAMAAAHCRRISRGLLDALPTQTQIPRIETYAAIVWQIEDAQQAVDNAKANDDRARMKLAKQELKQAKCKYENEFGEKYSKSSSPPPLLRPKTGLWSGYRRADSDKVMPSVPHSHFDTDLLILTCVDGPQLPVVSTLAVSRTLRAAVLKHCSEPVPTWVSGHDLDGSPSEDRAGHMAFLPLPFVGSEHADGHLLGMALAFPRNIDRRERGRAIGPLVIDRDGQPRDVELRLGRLGVWVVRKRDWSERRRSLTPETWTAYPEGSHAWASVTPVVLDRYPKANRSDPEQREAWERQVREIVACACARIELPAPVYIDIDTTSWHIGCQRGVTKGRKLRGKGTPPGRTDAALGEGFPRFPAKGTNAPRPQLHVLLQFAEPVLGPVLLGAGRYQGYGLLKPWGGAQ